MKNATILGLIASVALLFSTPAHAGWRLEITDTKTKKKQQHVLPEKGSFKVPGDLGGWSCLITAEKTSKGEPEAAFSRSIQCEEGNHVMKVTAFRAFFAILHLARKKPRATFMLELMFVAPKKNPKK